MLYFVHITDVSPPTFLATCPASPSLLYAERGLFSAHVNWSKPVATDNSGVPPSVKSNYQPPQRFSQGTHVIIYTAEDQSGNKATCSFTIEVIGNNYLFCLLASCEFSSRMGLTFKAVYTKMFGHLKKASQLNH